MKLIRSYPILGAIAAQVVAGAFVFAVLMVLASSLDA